MLSIQAVRGLPRLRAPGIGWHVGLTRSVAERSRLGAYTFYLHLT